MLQKQKSLLTKCLAFLFIICCSVVMVLGITACSKEKTITSIKVEGTTLILTWSDGSEEKIETKGEAGKPGEPGKSPVVKIGDNGNWFIDDVDTGVAATGKEGKPGEAGHTPVVAIGENGNWTIDGKDTGVASTGAKGEDAPQIKTIKYNEDGTQLIFTFDNGATIAVEVPAADKCDHSKRVEKIPYDYNTNSKCEYKQLVVCLDCGHVAVENVVDHKWSEEPVDLPRKDCFVGARSAKVCKNCGAEKDVVYKSAEEDGTCYTEHQDEQHYTYQLDVKDPENKKPCELDTYELVKCEACGATISNTLIKKAEGHTYGEWVISTGKTPSLTNGGQLERRCERNDDVEYKEIAALRNEDGTVNSFYTYTAPTAPSCSADRKGVYTFTYGEKEFKVEIAIAKTKHIVNGNEIDINGDYYFDDAKYAGKIKWLGGATALSCGKAGTPGFFTCEECGDSFDITVRKAHKAFDAKVDTKSNEVAASCSSVGGFDYICTDCGSTAHVETEKLAHNYVVKKILPATDEHKFGGYEATCSVGGESITGWFEEAPETVYHEATCDKGAYTEYVGYNINVLDEKNPALGHNHKDLGKLGTLGDAQHPIDLRDAKYTGKFIGINSSTSDGKAISCGNTSEAKPGRAVYTCTRCEGVFEVYAYMSHTGKTTVTKEPTCTEDGWLSIEKCDDCGATDGEPIPAKGHSYSYTVAEKDAEDKVTKLHGVCTVCEAEHDLVVSSYRVTKLPSCEETGTAVVTYVDDKQVEQKDKTIDLATVGHTRNGVEIRNAYDKPYTASEAKELGIIVKGQGAKPTCADFEEGANPNALYECTVCHGYFDTYVKGDHTKPNDYKAPVATCEKAGTTTWNCANEDCGHELQTETVPALGHKTHIEVKDGKMIVTCEREGCDFEAVEIELPAIPELKLNDENVYEFVESDNYDVKQVVAVTCSNSGHYKFVVKKDVLKKLLAAKNAYLYNDELADVVFEKDIDAPHKYDSKVISWTDGEYEYTGNYCELCHNIVNVKRGQRV